MATLNLPLIALAAAALMLSGASLPGQPAAQEAARGVQMKCQEKYCPPNYQIQVDRALNTLGTDQSLGKGMRVGEAKPSLLKVYNSGKQRFYQEAHEHPGVRLVAQAVS
jgi:hypothetical protein